MNELITCIIPCHNGSQTIERAVKSAFEAGCNKVSVYDDASEDGTWDIIQSLFSLYRIPTYDTYGYDFRVGVNAARNYLVSHSADGLIIPLDADDELYDIGPLVEAYESGVWVYGDHNETLSGKTLGPVKASPPGSLPRKEITGVTFMFHKSDWAWVGGYDPDFAYAEDYAFQCALANAGVKPKYVDTVVYNRYLHPDGNERSARAGLYWSFYRDMARSKYPAVFAGTG